VEYEPLPFVTDLEAAMTDDAPKIWSEGNIPEEPTVYDRGDSDTSLAGADVTVEMTFHTAAALHNGLEPHGATAMWEGDRLALWSSTQSVFTVRQMVAEALGLPEHRLRVIKQHMGGGFGAKQIAW